MKDDSRKAGDLESSPGQGRDFASRRTVIKALASTVPVVMTIGCGKALADASNLACIVKTPPPIEDVCIDGTDQWVREPTLQFDPVTGDPIIDPDTGEQVTQNCLLYVNEQGDPIPAGSGYPVTVSCYASFI